MSLEENKLSAHRDRDQDVFMYTSVRGGCSLEAVMLLSDPPCHLQIAHPYTASLRRSPWSVTEMSLGVDP